MEQTHQYRGDLGTTALPEMLVTIYRTRVAGVIAARREGIVKRIWIKDGDITYATSNERHDSLGHWLRRAGRLSEDDLTTTSRLLEASQKRFGELLIERGQLSPKEVGRAIREQVKGIIWSLFTWESGEVTFSLGEGEPQRSVRILVPMRQAIVQGIRRAPDVRSLVARLGSRDTVFEPVYRSEDLIEIALDDREYALLLLVNGRRTLFEICTQGPLSPAENGKLLYAFHVLQLIRKREREESTGIKIRMKTDREA